jgi:hypothetical protein
VKDEYYNSAEARLDTVAGQQTYWKMLRSAHKEFLSLSLLDNIENFKHYIHDTYGVDMQMIDGVNILPTYTIVDEQKHLIFLLKHSKHEN